MPEDGNLRGKIALEVELMGHKPLCQPHQSAAGLPRGTYVVIELPFSPVDGSHILLVQPDQVRAFTLRAPYNHHQWEPCGEVETYDSKEQLKEILARRTRETIAPCWAS